MSKVVSITGNAALRMTSRMIAELTDKEHRNVTRDIRKILRELYDEEGVLSFEQTYRNEQNGQEYLEFNLPRREVDILLTGYSIPLRAKVIDRWRELEAEVAKPQVMALPDFTNPAVAARAWASEFEGRVLALEVVKVHEQKIAEDAPKVQFHDDVTDATNTQTIQEVAKVLQMGPNKLFQFLRDNNILMEEPYRNLPYQKHMDAGHFKVVEKEFTKPSGEITLTTRTLVTGKGLTYIQKKLAKANGRHLALVA